MCQVRHILLSVKNGKIMIPKQLQKSLVEWYHNILCHPGETRMELTIGQYFHLKGIWNFVDDICSECHTSQFLKHCKRNYGKLPTKQAETQPWDKLFIDIIGKYRMTLYKGGSYDRPSYRLDRNMTCVSSQSRSSC